MTGELLLCAATVTCIGKVVPGELVIRVAGEPGTVIADLKVRKGDMVRKGDPLAFHRGHETCQAALQAAEAEVAKATSRLALVRAGEKPEALAAQRAASEQQRALLANAEVTCARVRDIFSRGLVSKAELDQAETSLSSARESSAREAHQLASLKHVRAEDVAMAQADLASAVAARGRAAAELDRTVFVAPCDGQVLEVHAYQGEATGDGGLLELGDVANMHVEAEVYASDFARVRMGAVATMTGAALSRPLTGRVVELGRYVGNGTVFPVDPLSFSDRRVVKVRIRLDDGAAAAGLSNAPVDVEIRPGGLPPSGSSPSSPPSAFPSPGGSSRATGCAWPPRSAESPSASS